MEKYSFKKLDAFATGKSSGNPAGYVFVEKADDIADAEMQQIAYELKGFVSEVGYVFPTDSAEYDYSIRYFSCEKEVPFCGHATVAIMYDLIKNSAELLDRPFLRIKTLKGILRVENRIIQEDMVYIYAPEPLFLICSLKPESIAGALNLAPENLDMNEPPAVANAGMNTLIVCLNGIQTCVSCLPDYNELREFVLTNGIEIVTIYTREVSNPANDLRTRVFAPAFGYLEDPATGSGNAALGYHLWNTGKWGKESMVIEQGPSLETPNIIKLKKALPDRIMIGGNSICRINGEYLV
jgi:PhzF family phenazine biosynthesis protein